MRSTRSSAVLSSTTASSLLVALACAACRSTTINSSSSSDCGGMLPTSTTAVFVDGFNPLRQLRRHLGILDKQHQQQHDRQTTGPSPLSVPAADLYRDDANDAPVGIGGRVAIEMPSSVEEGAAVRPIILPTEEKDATVPVDSDLDGVVLPSLGGEDDDSGCVGDNNGSSEPPRLADTPTHGDGHTGSSTSSDHTAQSEQVRRTAEDPISSGNHDTLSNPASAAAKDDNVPSVLEDSGSSSSKDDARAHKEELLHRSLLQTRLELEAHRQRSRSQSLLLLQGTTAEGASINNLREKVSKVQQRVRSLPLFQLNSTSDLLAEVAPPDGLGDILSANTTLAALATRCMESSLSSVVDLIISVLFACRAVYRTVMSDGEVRNIWQCAGKTIGTATRRCLRSGRDETVIQSKTPEGALARRTKIIIASAGVAVSSVILSMWAFVLGVACSSEACRGVGTLRDSAREATAAVLFGAATVVRAVGALGRDIVSRIRAAQLPVDVDA
mmetsp:Transcript_16659/g.36264  ORF Transcript_16659/g.36264 Transcript_16659/m.36264 type:complete len:500 (+) Transcript_16659:34-1533(+)